MIAQTIALRESTHFYRDNDKFFISLTHHPDNILIPVTEAQARTLVVAGVARNQIIRHYPSFLGRSSCQFQTGNELTAVMNETGDPDCLLSLVIFDQNHWLAWVAGEGDQFHIFPDSLVHRILTSARSQAGLTQPTLHARGHGRYLFVQPNTFAACLRPQKEVQVSGRLVDVEGATAAQLHRRLVGAWRQGAFG